MKAQRRSNKKVFTATHKEAKYIGEHPALKGTEGVFYYSLEQGVNIYRPNLDGAKGDWFRIPDKRNLEGI